MSSTRHTRFIIDGQPLNGAETEYPAAVSHIVDVIIGTQQQRSQSVWKQLLKNIQAVQCMVKAINLVE